MTDKHRERGTAGDGSKGVPSLAQLDLSFVPHSDVVRTGSALPAAQAGTRLRCQGHDRQLATRFGQFSRLSQRRFTRAAWFEDGKHASGWHRSSRVDRTLASFLVSYRRHGRGHVEQR